MSPGTRVAELEYATRETSTRLKLDVDGSGQASISTGIGFLDHMLEQLVFHGLLDLELTCKGDLEVDSHHTVEDVAIAIGRALDQALGDRAGIRRYGQRLLPMDETLARVALDLSGRPDFHFQGRFGRERLGELETQMVPHFFKSISLAGRITLHMALLCGENDHHKCEALFKGFGRALCEAAEIDPRRAGISSTKGVL
jgi:imidazoleglycerol-phosphate dehydratase